MTIPPTEVPVVMTSTEPSRTVFNSLSRRLRVLLSRGRKLVGFGSALALSLSIVIGVFLRAFESFSGYISWGNFLTPLTLGQIRAPAVGWEPYQYNGFPTLSSLTNVLSYVEFQGPIQAIGSIVGIDAAVKAFVALSALSLGLSFYFLTGGLTRRLLPRLLGVAFLLANPFQLYLYGQGDFTSFVAQSLFFLSLGFLLRAAVVSPLNWRRLLVAVVLLGLTVSNLQIFYLGSGMFLVFALYFATTASLEHGQSVTKTIGITLARCLLIPVVALPFLLPLLTGSTDVTPGSLLAQPLSSFRSTSSPMYSLLTLQPNPPGLAWEIVRQTFGPLGFELWTAVVVLFVISAFAASLVLRDFRILLLDVVVLFAAALGAGPAGPFSAAAIALYTHVPGYQVLNASYLWVWDVIAPSYGLITVLIADGLLAHRYPSAIHRVVAPVTSRLPRWHRPKISWSTALLAIFVTGVTLLAAVPISSQGYYRASGGIHEYNLPPEYANLPAELSRLVGSNYTGVAFLNPDLNLFLPNVSGYFSNPLFLYPSVRTAGLPFYGAPSLQSNYYFLWAYHLFYTNETRSFPALMSLMGIQFLVDLYNSNSASFYPYFMPWSAGVNASHLLQYQEGVVKIYSGSAYAIYRIEGPVQAATSYASLDLVLGDYNALPTMAALGLNLSAAPILFQSDITASDCTSTLANTSLIFLEGASSFLGLSLPCSGMESWNPVSYVSNTIGPDQGWSNSLRTLGSPIVDAQPAPVALADGTQTLQIPISVDCGANCVAWASVLFEPDAGAISFQDGRSAVSVNTTAPLDGATGEFGWVPLPDLVPNGNSLLRVVSSGRENAIGRIYIGTPSQLAVWESVQNATVSKHDITVVSGLAGDQVGLPSSVPTGESTLYQYVEVPTGNAPEGSFLYLQSPTGAPGLPLPVDLPSVGVAESLVIGVRNLGTATLEVQDGGWSTVVGFDTGNYSAARKGVTWIRVDLPSDVGTSAVSLRVLNGTIFVALVAVEPTGLMDAADRGVAFGAVTYESRAPNVPNFTLFTTAEPNGTTLAGSLSYSNTSYFDTLVTVAYSGRIPPGSVVGLRGQISPGLLLDVNGFRVAPESDGRGVLADSDILPGGNAPPGSPIVFRIRAYGSSSTEATNATFLLTVSFVLNSSAAVVHLTPSVLPWNDTVTAITGGIEVRESHSAPFVLVRVGYYPGFDFTGCGAGVEPALGGLEVLARNVCTSAPLRYVAGDTQTFEIGIGLEVAGLSAYSLAEYGLARRKLRLMSSRQTHERVG